MGMFKRVLAGALLCFSAALAHAGESNVIVLFHGAEGGVNTYSSLQRVQQANAFFNPMSMFLPKPVVANRVFTGANAFSAELDQEQIQALIASGEVADIIPNFRISLPEHWRKPVAKAPAGEPFTYGLVNTGVKELRAKHPEIDGHGVVVGILDTGIQADHPDLDGKVIAFKNFAGTKNEPYDDNGHGTHVAGTIAGGSASGTAIGMAPGAKLVIGKIFGSSGSATAEGIFSGMEWMLEQKPALVSNSWGGGQDEKDLAKEPFKRFTDAWIAAGIIPVFAAGNDGPRAGTVGSPAAIPNVIAVAAVDSSNKTAYFSSRGPVKWKEEGKVVVYEKPDVAAPGKDVYSSVPGGKYEAFSGTSMATPHVSGALALYLQMLGRVKPEKALSLLCGEAKKLDEAKTSVGCGMLQVNFKK